MVGPKVLVVPTIKGNAYGHGLLLCARVFEKAGVGFLGLNAIYEARALREAGIACPLLLLGYTPLSALAEAVALRCDLVVYNPETLEALGKIGLPASVHLKIETGTHRQGVELATIPMILRILRRYPMLKLAGVSTHFANLEDRISHQYALMQLTQFNEAVRLLESNGYNPRYRHAASTAASLILPEAHFNLARVGIGSYGLWPSEKTKQAMERTGLSFSLEPALTWKTIVAQAKAVKKGALIGYGCSYKMPRDGRIAVLPVGYYDGYARGLGNNGAVLIRGHRAPVVGRICMNMFMVDVTTILDVRPEDEAVLIGRQEKEVITAEQVALWSQTINYEATTRINERILRTIVD